MKQPNGTWTNYAKGIVYHCEIWDQALGDKDCYDLVSWPREDFEFDIVSFGDYDNSSNSPTRIDFFAAQYA